MATHKLGRYEILSELGQGAMGVVYKAIDPLIERTVAIKTINLNLSTEELANFEERFYREAKSAGQLNHPNIVTIYDIGKSENCAYMAMEFMQGRLLRDILDTHTALGIAKIVDITAQIADGLAYAHDHGIVHRDIKPANIMLVRDDVAKIMDFGIAQMPSGSRTLAGTILGSPKYMAPEQIVGKTVDGRSDIFALGVILYEMLTGEPPFDGDNINTIMYRIINDDPPPPKSLAPRLPERFNQIIARALHKEPEQRYQNARELATDLRNYNHSTTPQTGTSKTTTSLLSKSKVRRQRPSATSREGDATLLINPLPIKTTPTSTDKSAQLASYVQQHRNTLFAGMAVLMVVIVILIIRSEAAQPKQTPPQVASSAPLPGNPASTYHPQGVEPVAANQSTTKLSLATTVAPENDAGKPKPAKHVITNLNPTETKKAATGTAVVNFALSPWGEIYIDGKEAGISPPLKKLTIPAGKHKIEVRNAQLQPYSEIIDLKAASSISIKHIFQ